MARRNKLTKKRINKFACKKIKKISKPFGKVLLNRELFVEIEFILFMGQPMLFDQ